MGEDLSEAYGRDTFIKITEAWIPNRDRTQLEYYSGIYGPYTSFGTYSKSTTFDYGEGLPGKAWKLRRPVLVPKLDNTNFKRHSEANLIGMDCGIAYPIFAGELLTGVVVFLCQNKSEESGAVEIWAPDPTNTAQLRLSEGHFGGLSEFEYITRRLGIRKGQGLPGKVWEYRMPILSDKISESKTFIRSAEATKVGITRALGIPCMSTPNQLHVLSILSSKQTPIAGRFEIWGPDHGRRRLVLFDAADEDSPSHMRTHKYTRIKRGEGIIGRAWSTCMPQIEPWFEKDGTFAVESAIDADYNHMVAIPVFKDGYLSTIVVWYF